MSKLCRYLRVSLIALFALSFQPAAAVEDCFSSYCTGLESVTGHAWSFFTLPGYDEKKTSFFRHAGDIDFNKASGPERFAIAGRTFWRDASPGMREDVMKLRLRVLNTNNRKVLSDVVTTIVSDEYDPTALFGANRATSFTGGAGIINGANGSRHIGMIFHVLPLGSFSEGSGFVVAEVRNMDGSKRWRTEFLTTTADDEWQLLGVGQVAVDDAVLFGDFLGGGDMVDELRLIYFKKAGKGTQTFRYDYYNVKTGNNIRSDTFSVKVP